MEHRRLRTVTRQVLTWVRSRWYAQHLPRELRPVIQVPGMIKISYAELLYRNARTVQDGCIVEVGSYRGRSTVALAIGSSYGGGVPVYAIEPHESFRGVKGGIFGPEDRASFFKSLLRTGCYRQVRLVNLPSHTVSPGWKEPVGMLWIDGDHSYEAVKRDFECWRPHLVPGAIVVFDDVLPEDLGSAIYVRELLERGELSMEQQLGAIMVCRAPPH